ncbi:U3 small nucleolar RNA-associated protein 7 [Kwoniella mangroviensis CBS 8886]|nr:U3 small nucleolar RNA-associated protein 7 [Kwoniella mangroviensis CBS 8886]
MDALLASAGPLPTKKQNYKGKQSSTYTKKSGPTSHQTIPRADGTSIDPSLHSILSSTRIPAGFHQSNLASGSGSTPIKPDVSIGRIQDKKLRSKLARQDITHKQAKLDRQDVNEWLNKAISGDKGGIEVDEELGEKTWRVKQSEISDSVSVGSKGKKFDLKFEGMGSYKVDYTRNGRHLAIASSKGHVATFDWQAGKLHSEIQLKESIRDIKFLHSQDFYAVAQKKYVFIYDQNGVELHKLKQHIDPTHMEFLPYHYLLATVGHAGYLKYHDTSTGVMLTQIPSHLGSPHSMAQNPHSAIIHLGHANGTMTLWSPNMTTPHVKLLAHRGPVNGIAVDPSETSAGRYVATSGMDGVVKIWDGRMWGKEVRSWHVRNQVTTLGYSGMGMLSVGGKSGVTVYRDLHSGNIQHTPTPYLTLPLPSLTASSVKFCPFDDLLCVGHEKGISSLLVPGSGEPNFDSNEADLYETYSRKRERDVRGLLEKIRPELITLDTDFLGHISESRGGETFEERNSRSYRQLGRLERLRMDGKADEPQNQLEDEDEEGEGEGGEGEATQKEKVKRKMKGKGGSTSRYLRKKQKKNIVDNSLLAMKAKVAAQKKAEDTRRKIANGEIVKETGALARFA